MKRQKWLADSSLLLAGVSVLLLSGCLTIDSEPAPKVVQGQQQGASANGFLSAQVAPGGSGSCSSAPCTIYYRTPDVGHPVEVVVNNFIVGTFPPGKVVNLGNYNDPTTIISTKDAGVPNAYVNMPGNSL